MGGASFGVWFLELIWDLDLGIWNFALPRAGFLVDVTTEVMHDFLHGCLVSFH
jgi:hypothetical protein